MTPEGARRVAGELPLLGPARDRVRAALAALASEATLPPRLLLRVADLARLDGDPDAGRRLEAAVAAAEAAGDALTAWLGRVQRARWAVEDGGAPAALARPAAVALDGEVRAEEALYEAVSAPRRAREAWGRALEGLPRPARDHDRLAVLEILAQAEREVGDRAAARKHLAAAAALARDHDSPADALRVELLLATLLLESGQADAALPPLTRCLALSPPGSWQRLAAAAPLAALQLAAGELAGAEATARLQVEAARARGNWLAAADGAMTLADCALRRDALVDGVSLLLTTATEARAAGNEAAVSLLKARLAELRQEVGPARFDPALAAAGRRG